MGRPDLKVSRVLRLDADRRTRERSSPPAACLGSVRVAFALLLLALAAPAAAHGGAHGLDLRDVRFVIHAALPQYEEVSFVVQNEPLAPTRGLKAHIEYAPYIKDTIALPELGAGETAHITLLLPTRVSAHGCVVVASWSKASDEVCALPAVALG
jgi:hypothetical protein